MKQIIITKLILEMLEKNDLIEFKESLVEIEKYLIDYFKNNKMEVTKKYK